MKLLALNARKATTVLINLLDYHAPLAHIVKQDQLTIVVMSTHLIHVAIKKRQIPKLDISH
jgi:hypothetical protein